MTSWSLNLQKQTAELARNRQKPTLMKEKVRLDGIKTAESPVVTAHRRRSQRGRQGLGPPRDDRRRDSARSPGLAVIKRVSAVEAEPGDTLTYVIIYRNMGNTPISTVAIVDSLLPRLEYVKGTSRGSTARLHHRDEPRRLDRAAAGSSPAS